jgi:tRNA-dihydrouridine synthase B
MAADAGAQIIDLNFGCPAKEVSAGQQSGSAMMREPDLAEALVAAAVAAVNVPVTVKMRLGWDDNTRNAADIARRAEAAGAKAITVHGRTRSQFYKGVADWSAVAAVKAAVSVPVLVNGDIIDGDTARDGPSAIRRRRRDDRARRLWPPLDRRRDRGRPGRPSFRRALRPRSAWRSP